jgi:tetratricopeptide (TPR) repeat protein
VTHLILVALLGAPAPPALDAAAARSPAGVYAPQQAARAAAGDDPIAGAYAEFVLSRQLADKGDVDGAVGALQRAMKLDPKSADLPAELAGLYARESRVRESIDAANTALALDPGHGEANRVLGSIYASLA